VKSTDNGGIGGRSIKKLHTDRVLGSGRDDEEETVGKHLLDSVRSMTEAGSTASRTFLMEPWEVEEWIDGGKLERVLDSFLVSRDLDNKKERTSANYMSYELEDGLSIHVRKVPGEELEPTTDRYILSIGLEGIKGHNANRAQDLFYDLEGIPI
jgi:hypothetical protein